MSFTVLHSIPDCAEGGQLVTWVAGALRMLGYDGITPPTSSPSPLDYRMVKARTQDQA